MDKRISAHLHHRQMGPNLTSSHFREHLSNANVSILEALHEAEENAGGHAYQERGRIQAPSATGMILADQC